MPTARGPRIHQTYPPDRVLQCGFLAIEQALDSIFKALANSDSRALVQHWNENLKKHALEIDIIVQTRAEATISDQLDGHIEFRGEESSLRELPRGAELAVLLDMVDGTDLLERNFGNWCSAMVFFDVKHARVLEALIGTPNREIYHTRRNSKKAFVREPSSNGRESTIREIRLQPKRIKLRDASLCFYGQKAGSLFRLITNEKFTQRLKEISEESDRLKRSRRKPKLRIYNLAGNPMMMSLIEGKVDAIVEISGQYCHDVVPGFVIALKAGAYLINLDDGSEIDLDLLGNMLAQPSFKFRYVLACNRNLCRELVDLLAPPQISKSRVKDI